MIYLLLTFTIISTFILGITLLKEKKKNKFTEKQYKELEEKDLQLQALNEEKEMAEAELKIIKTIYRNKLLNLNNDKKDIA